ncbi:MAG: metallophosphoesterase [Clostridia bacterium]
MQVYAIGDLHLSFSAEKPMDVFGESWRDHTARLYAAWQATVGAEDLVMIPGDISWAMQLAGALPDLAFIDELPGNKLLLRGNHDYWWSSLTRVRGVLPKGMYALQNDVFCRADICVCGTRGWTCPGSAAFTAEDEKIYLRELQRLELSLKAAPDDKMRIVMLHFPPFNEKRQASGFTELIEHYGADQVVYAHLHGAAHKHAFSGERGGVQYTFVAADYLQFVPKRII